MSQNLRQRPATSLNSTGDNVASQQGAGLKYAGLSVQSMHRAFPQHKGKVRKLRVPFLYTLLPQFLQRFVLKVWCFSFLRPIWQSRYLIVLGSYLYKFKDDDGRCMLNQQPNGSPVRLDHINVHLVTASSVHEDDDALVASGLLNKSIRDDASCIFCIVTLRKRYYYVCQNHEDTLIWVNTLREASQECITRTMGHAVKDSFPSNWKYYDVLGQDLANRKDRIRTRLQQANLRELEMSNFNEGGPLPRGYYG